MEFNCVQRATLGGMSQVFHSVFHRLTQDQYLRVKAHLSKTFITSGTPTALWSLALGHGLGTLLKATGGGTGGVYFTKESVDTRAA